MKRILIALCLVVVAAFGFDWGIYGGAGASATLTDMDLVQADLSGYDIPSFDFYQVGLCTPIYVRFWNFTIGGGDTYSWQSASGPDYKASLHHDINQGEFGYVINLSEHLRLRPVIGIGNYHIDLRVSELGGGFGDPDGGSGESTSYDYDNFSMSAGAALAYVWKFESRVVFGLEAKARYLVPFETNAGWIPDDYWDDEVYIPEFYPHTPIITLNFFIGYEDVDENNWIEEDDWDEWEEG